MQNDGAMQDDREMKEVDELTFRQAMAELERIVEALESNTLELEESLRQYERGVSLIVSLKGRLAQAQQKVDVLMGELSGVTDDATQDTTLS